MADIESEYRTVARGAGFADRSARGRVRVEGADARAFLHGLLSNDISSLQPGQGVYATYLTVQGRMICDMEVYRHDDHLLVDVVERGGPPLVDRLDRLIFAEDVRVTDVSNDTGEIVVVGNGATVVVAKVTGLPAASLEALAELAHARGEDATVARSGDAKLPAFKVFFEAGRTDALRERLVAAGTPSMSDELLDALRIEAGRPAFGIDMDETTIPLEAGLLPRGISTSKGCYVGQEVIIRVLHRGGGRVAKRLAMLSIDSQGPVERGAKLLVESREVGHVMSVRPATSGVGSSALAYVVRDFAEEGRRFSAGEGTATVVGFAS